VTGCADTASLTVRQDCFRNRPPVAQCKDVRVSAGAMCLASASIDDASFDPDPGDTITLVQSPPGPYPLGTTSVTLTVTDSQGASSTCRATVTVTVGNECPKSQGFWKNKPNLWPAAAIPMTLGSESYTKPELLAIMGTPSSGDASLILAHQLIAAILNTANGGDPRPICNTTAQANSLLSTFGGKLPYNVKPSSSTGKQMVQLASILEQYNAGGLTPGCNP